MKGVVSAKDVRTISLAVGIHFTFAHVIHSNLGAVKLAYIVVSDLIFAGLFIGYAITDVIDAFEGRNDLFVVGDNDYGGFKFTCHIV